MTKFILLLSILCNAFGLSQTAINYDRDLVSRQFGSDNTAYAESSSQNLPDILNYPIVAENASSPKIYAKNYLIMDSDTGVVLAAKDSDAEVPIASTTKIMTAIIALENYDLDDVLTVPSDVISLVYSYGATPDFYTGETMTVRNLLHCLLLVSSNTAADTLANNMNKKSGFDMTNFIAKMNEKAKLLGMNNTNYHDPAGLDITGYSTANDLTIITRYAMKNQIFADIVKTSQETLYDTTGTLIHILKNSNRLVGDWNYPGAIGVKTGYMPGEDSASSGAGHCLVAAVKRDGHTLISVVLNTTADTATASAEESEKLQDWAWENVSWL